MFRWFFNLKTSVKLISAFIFIALIQVAVGFFALTNMEKINEGMDQMYNENLQPMEHISETRYLFQSLNVMWRDITLSDSPVEKARYMKDIKRVRNEVERSLELYSGKKMSKEQKEILEKFYPAWKTYNQAYDQSIDLLLSGIEDYEKYIGGDLQNHQENVARIMNQLIAADVESAERANVEAGEMYSATKIILIGNIILSVLISIIFGIIISQIISRPLKNVVNLVEKVAEGDLTETSNINTRDEVGLLAQSVNKMIVNLRGIIQNILSAAENLSASSAQVSASTEEIANASSNQANAVHTMNELFRELSDAIHAVAQNTEHAAELSSETIKIAEDGEKVVRSTVKGAQLASEQITRLEQDSSRIGEIIEVIDDISDQTNLLALNAAIEAARAGEQGRGFAVVADEVRKLAERSGEATTQISSIIKEMQEATALSVKSMEEGVAYTRRSGEAFENIIRMIHETGQKVTEIAGASEEQSAQSAEVLSFIENISAATEEATASSEETASTALALTNLAEELHVSVAAFKLDENFQEEKEDAEFDVTDFVDDLKETS